MSGTSYTPSLRFALMTPGDPAVRNSWGTILDQFISVAEGAITGGPNIDLTSVVSPYALTLGNNTPDQARLASYEFTGTPATNVIVVMPAVPKTGKATNHTSHTVTLTTGSGITASINPGYTIFYTCDGVNVVVNSIQAALISATAISGGNLIGSVSASNWNVRLPGGLTLQGGTATGSTGGNVQIFFSPAFSSATGVNVIVCAKSVVVPTIAQVTGTGATATSFLAATYIVSSAGAAYVTQPFNWFAFGPT